MTKEPTREEFDSDVCPWLIAGIKNLWSNDAKLFKFNVGERAITHRLGMYLTFLFPEFDVDCEYNKMGELQKSVFLESEEELTAESLLSRYGVYEESTPKERYKKLRKQAQRALEKGLPVNPDIIVHKRGTTANYLVIEAKKASNPRQELDQLKLETYTSGNLHYRFGVAIVIDKRRAVIVPWISGVTCGKPIDVFDDMRWSG